MYAIFSSSSLVVIGLSFILAVLISFYSLGLLAKPPNLGIKLVIVFPTMLFLIGSGYKASIQKRSLENTDEVLDRAGGKLTKEESDEYWNRQFNDFAFTLMVDSVFFFIANGLIIIFQINQVELGVFLLIIGVIFSMCSLVGIYSDSENLEKYGIILAFMLLYSELGFFWIHDMINIPSPFLFLSCLPFSVLGIGMGGYIRDFPLPEGNEEMKKMSIVRNEI